MTTNFKPGDKVICIDNDISNLILNKVYTVKEYPRDYFFSDRVILYETERQAYYQNRFILDMKETRKQKLKKICSNQAIK